MKKTTNESCKTCHYYRESFCKRRAPKVFRCPSPEYPMQHHYEEVFPYMAESNWCGEYKRRDT
jgi:hypothetical protein